MTGNGQQQDVTDLLHKYFTDGLSHHNMVQVLRTEHNILLSERTLRRRLAALNLWRCNVRYNQNHLRNAIEHEVSTTGGNLGYRSMHNRLRLTYGISVPRSTVQRELSNIDPEGVTMRTANTLRRREYTSKGPNYLIHVDGYDKLKRYGICIHGAIDGYSKKLLWLNAGHSNNDPKYVGWFFCQYIKEIKAVPRCVRMDRGTENTLIEDIQASFRSTHTDDMAQNSVLYGSSNHNQPIERWWRCGRQLAIQFYMDFFKDLELQGLFEVGNRSDAACIRYCFLHIVQQKIKEVQMEWNTHRSRSSRCNIGGIPNILYSHPQLQGSVDYKTAVEESDIEQVSGLCAPPKDRGCDADQKEQFDGLVTRINGSVTVPCCLEEARQLYVAIRTAL